MDRKNFLNLFYSLIVLQLTFFITNPASILADEIKSKELITIDTRNGVTQKFVLLKPEKALASLILFNGGDGRIQSGSTFGVPYINAGNNFLVRTREEFAKHGFTVAVIDVPSDCDQTGMSYVWRVGENHVQDIKGVIDYLKKQENIPVFLVGTSAGTMSVGVGGIHLAESVNGLVFSSAVTSPDENWPIYKNYPNGVLNLNLDKITKPCLILAHKGDECKYSPPSGAPKLVNALVNSPKAELMLFEGGNPKEKGCSYWAQHSYYGIEEKVVSDIANFIKSNI